MIKISSFIKEICFTIPSTTSYTRWFTTRIISFNVGNSETWLLVFVIIDILHDPRSIIIPSPSDSSWLILESSRTPSRWPESLSYQWGFSSFSSVMRSSRFRGSCLCYWLLTNSSRVGFVVSVVWDLLSITTKSILKKKPNAHTYGIYNTIAARVKASKGSCPLKRPLEGICGFPTQRSSSSYFTTSFKPSLVPSIVKFFPISFDSNL